MDLRLEHHFVDEDITVIEITGEIDVYTAPRLRELVIDLIDSGHVWLIADLSGAEYVDSTGLGVITGTLKRTMAHGGALCLIITADRLLRGFRISGLTKVFRILDSPEAAIEMFSAEPFKAKMLPGILQSNDDELGVHWFPGRIFTSAEGAIAEVEKAWCAVLNMFGLEAKACKFSLRHDPRYREFIVRVKNAGGSPASVAGLPLMRRALEEQILNLRTQAGVAQNQAVADLIIAVAKTPNVIVQSGSALLVKVGDTVVVRNPAELELARWERIPGFFRDPERVLHELRRPLPA